MALSGCEAGFQDFAPLPGAVCQLD